MTTIEAGRRLRLVLPSDKDKEPQRAFYTRYLTARRYRELAEGIDKFRTAKGPNAVTLAIEISESLLIDWENVTHPDTGELVPFSTEAIQDVLSTEDICELNVQAYSGNRLSEDDRKKSE